MGFFPGKTQGVGSAQATSSLGSRVSDAINGHPSQGRRLSLVRVPLPWGHADEEGRGLRPRMWTADCRSREGRPQPPSHSPSLWGLVHAKGKPGAPSPRREPVRAVQEAGPVEPKADPCHGVCAWKRPARPPDVLVTKGATGVTGPHAPQG